MAQIHAEKRANGIYLFVPLKNVFFKNLNIATEKHQNAFFLKVVRTSVQ